jgi:hypothetical protein
MKFKYLIGVLVTISFQISCASETREQSLIKLGSKSIQQCRDFIEDKTEQAFLQEINLAYFYVFNKGTIVAFTEGAVGTFGKRDKNYKQHWACGFYKGEIVHASSPLKEPILDLPIGENFEVYDSSVQELLFKKIGNGFDYCCQQPFDPKNIETNNPEHK